MQCQRGQDHLHLHLARRRYRRLGLLHTCHANEVATPAPRSLTFWPGQHRKKKKKKAAVRDHQPSAIIIRWIHFSTFFPRSKRCLSAILLVRQQQHRWSDQLAVPFLCASINEYTNLGLISSQLANWCLSQKKKNISRKIDLCKCGKITYNYTKVLKTIWLFDCSTIVG